MENYINKSFINKYLESVAFEIRFPSSVKVLNDFGPFQEKINKKYPDFGEEYPFPVIPQTDINLKLPENLRKIMFKDRDDTTEIKLAMNSIAIITKVYKNRQEFLDRVSTIINSFIECFNIETSLRTGLRYRNLYPLKSDLKESLTIVNNKFNPIFNKELIPLERIISQDIQIRKEIDENIKITLRSQLYFDKKMKTYCYLLDFDTYNPNERAMVDYIQTLSSLRLAEKREFLSFVTEDFMSEMEFSE